MTMLYFNRRFIIPALVMLMCITGVRLSAKVYLVSVGVSDYPGFSNDLSYCVSDAEAVANVYDENTVAEGVILSDSGATIANIESSMRKVFSKADNDDIVVFFFSGHGYPGGFCAYDGNLSYAKVRKAMARSQSQYKMIFADACFAGAMRTNRQSNAATADAKKSNVMLFLSSRSNEVSSEAPEFSKGKFTYYLTQALRGYADKNRDHVITARELFDYVHSRVIEFTEGAQHPVMWGRYDDNMPVMIW